MTGASDCGKREPDQNDTRKCAETMRGVLLTAPHCQSRGRGFKSRRARHFSKQLRIPMSSFRSSFLPVLCPTAGGPLSGRSSSPQPRFLARPHPRLTGVKRTFRATGAKRFPACLPAHVAKAPVASQDGRRAAFISNLAAIVPIPSASGERVLRRPAPSRSRSPGVKD